MGAAIARGVGIRKQRGTASVSYRDLSRVFPSSVLCGPRPVYLADAVRIISSYRRPKGHRHLGTPKDLVRRGGLHVSS